MRLIHYSAFYVCFIIDFSPSRAVVTNPQLGVEVTTGGVNVVVGGGDGEETVPLSIVVPPQNLTVTRGSNIATLQCIANARYAALMQCSFKLNLYDFLLYFHLNG